VALDDGREFKRDENCDNGKNAYTPPLLHLALSHEKRENLAVMYMLKFISLPAFFLSFVIGLLFVYFLGSDKATVYMLPSPDTIDTTVYTNAETGQCYALKPREAACPGMFT